MNKVFSVLSIAFMAAIVLAGCTSNSPKPVAEKFLNSFWHMDYKDAKTVSDSATIQMIEMLETMSTTMADSDRQDAKKISVTVKDEKLINDTSAVVTYITSEIKEEKTLRLVKKNGKWLVNLTKNDNTLDEPQQQPDTTQTQETADTTSR
jgi:hypothetical protein